jgi:hypothetical protein
VAEGKTRRWGARRNLKWLAPSLLGWLANDPRAGGGVAGMES